MKYFSLIFLVFVFFSSSLKAADIKIIELHKNKTLDDFVLEKLVGNTQDQEVDNIIEEKNTEKSLEDISEVNLQDGSEQLDNKENVAFLKQETLFDLNENIINNHLQTIQNIKSKTLHREFIKILSNLELQNENIINNKIYFIIKKLYEIGEIGKAYDLIKSIDLNNNVKVENLNYFYLIELNYLFSTFNLQAVCELKSFLLNQTFIISEFLLEKTDIFCLTLENKYSEAKLLNSLLLDTEIEVDQNFQNLFKFMTSADKMDQSFDPLTKIKSEELIFLYSAMLRINELALNEDFIEIDPLNLSIPVILSSSTKMEVRIKAANKAYYDEALSIDSLSALYQSVDFNSSEFIKPSETIKSIENNELIMAYFFQLANIQIFPDQRLKVILDYWNFAQNAGLEKIAFAITKNITETFTPTSENIKFGMEIALAHISNRNFEQAVKWINLYEKSNSDDEKVGYAKFLIKLNEANDLVTIINYLNTNYSSLSNFDDQNKREIVNVLASFLNLEGLDQLEFSYDSIIDDRSMPSYFLIKDLKQNMKEKNDLSLFILSLISIDNKSWSQLHPEHLNLILNAYNLYNQGALIKPIILEILNELEIFSE